MNVLFVSLLHKLCLPVKSALQWSLDKPRFKLCKNKAEIVAVTDGQLSGDSASLELPYAILEVKPYLLRLPHFDSLMRQVGLEMVTWNSYCKTANRP